jgi:NAD(P) transhydrogenase subunit alpha
MKELYLLIAFVAAGLLGYKLINEVPSLLHTPLMSGMNALSGITVVGALVTTAVSLTTGSKVVGFVAIVLAMINVVAGFLVTHRMLKMFRSEGGRS